MGLNPAYPQGPAQAASAEGQKVCEAQVLRGLMERAGLHLWGSGDQDP